MPTITIGACILSSLDEADPLYQDRSRFEEYALTLRRGDAVQIDMDALPAPGDPAGAVGFDTYLELRRSGVVEPLVVNDDRPESLNSRLLFLAPLDETYTVTARSFGASAGRYVIRVTAVAPESADAISGDRISVTLPAAAASTGRRTRTYYFEGRADERVKLTLPTGPNSIFVEVADRAGAVVASAWSVEGRPNDLIAVLRDADRYYVRVSSAGEAAPAPFDIAMERAAPQGSARTERIAVGTPVEGALTLNSPLMDSDGGPGAGSFYRLYEAQTRESEPVTITVESLNPAIDPVVDVGAFTRAGFTLAATDDDGGGNLNSRLVLQPPHAATVLIRIHSFGLAVGQYRLLVSQSPHTERVFIHFAGTLTRERMTALATSLRAAGWQVQGDSQRIANAAGYNEVRYSAEADRTAAEALAASLTQAGIAPRPVTTRRLRMIRSGILEVWISN